MGLLAGGWSKGWQAEPHPPLGMETAVLGPLPGTAPAPLQEEELWVAGGVFCVRRGFSKGSCSDTILPSACLFLKVVAGVGRYIDIPGPKGERGAGEKQGRGKWIHSVLSQGHLAVFPYHTI